MMTRRLLLRRGTIGLAAICFAPWWATLAPAAEVFEVTHSDADWRKLLTPDQYAVLRQSDTESPFTSALLHEERRGTFVCAGCDLDLFSSTTKFDSGTGWPSFWAPLDRAIGTTKDTSSAWYGPPSIAAVVEATLVTSSTMAQSRRAFATA